MPTVFTEHGYRFFFVSYDCNEPMHIHVYKDNKDCKFWLRESTDNKDVVLSKNRGFKEHELNKLEKIIFTNFDKIKKLWHEHCKNTE